jgi:oxygen-dependent protoporphyrinogen oxidase
MSVIGDTKVEDQQKKIAIIGAGISGLSLCYFLNQLDPGLNITIYEKEMAVGGKIQKKDNFHLGPKTVLLREGSALSELIDKLGLKKKLKTPSQDSKIRYVIYQGKLTALPSSFSTFFKKPWNKGLLSLLKEPFIARKVEDETLECFFNRRIGKFLTEYIVDPFVKGIYGAELSELSTVSSFGALKKLEVENHSLIRGSLFKKTKKRKMISFENGMSELIETLQSQIQGQIVTNSEVKAIKSSGNEVVLEFNDGSSAFDHVFLATDLTGLKALSGVADFHSTSLTTVHFGYAKKLDLKGFGCLAPKNENQPFLGIVFDTAVFPHFSTHERLETLTVMIKGCEKEDEYYEAIAKEVTQKFLKVKESPSQILIQRYDEAILKPGLNFQESRSQFLKLQHINHPNVTFLGCWHQGAGVSDCVEMAQAVANGYEESIKLGSLLILNNKP